MSDLIWERMVEKQYWPGEDKPRIYVGKEVMAEKDTVDITWEGKGDHEGHTVRIVERWEPYVDATNSLSTGRVACSCGETWVVGGWPVEVYPDIAGLKETPKTEEEKPRYKEVYVPTYSAQRFMPMTGCTDCGVLVADKEAHDRHHEWVTSQSPTPPNPPWSHYCSSNGGNKLVITGGYDKCPFCGVRRAE